MEVRRSRDLSRLLVTAAATLLPALCATCLSSCIVTARRSFLFLSPGVRSLFAGSGTSLACLYLPDQVVYHPGRASITLSTA